jgi:hypothetical protein
MRKLRNGSNHACGIHERYYPPHGPEKRPISFTRVPRDDQGIRHHPTGITGAVLPFGPHQRPGLYGHLTEEIKTWQDYQDIASDLVEHPNLIKKSQPPPAEKSASGNSDAPTKV